MILSMLSFVGETLVEDNEWIAVVAGVVLGLGGFKLARFKRTFKKTAQVIHNLDDLTEDSLTNLIQQSIVKELGMFEQHQDTIVKDLFDRHNECHEEISKDLKDLKDNQTSIISQLFGVGNELAALRGRLEAK